MQQPITTIYFNFLKRDKSKNPERNAEANLTRPLEVRDGNPDNLAVITLPADDGLMAGTEYKDKKKSLKASDEYQKFLIIAQGLSDPKVGPIDFYISPRVRTLCSLDGGKIQELLNKSFLAVTGLKAEDILNNNRITPVKISPAQRQAVWVHFTKYELSNYIVGKLQPLSIHHTCKDGIDRGGCAAAIFNLMKSFEKDSTRQMTMDEFNREIQAPPTMMNARGMNHHVNVLWNVVNSYVQVNHDALMKDPTRAWLIEWRDLFCPEARVSWLLEKKLNQMKLDFASDPLVMAAVVKAEELKEKGGAKPIYILELLIHVQNLGAGKGNLNTEQGARLKTFMERDDTKKTGVREFLKGLINRIKYGNADQGAVVVRTHAQDLMDKFKSAIPKPVEMPTDDSLLVPAEPSHGQLVNK